MRRRGWTIRTKTTVAFALASMASTAVVLVMVALASQWTIAEVTLVVAPDDVATPSDGGLGADGRQVVPGPRPGSSGEGVSADAVPVPTPVLSQFATTQWGWSAVGVLVSGALAGGVGWSVSRRVLRPVEQIVQAARRLSASTLHERIALDGPDDELRRLARTIDDLLDRLETAFESQRRFVAQASHELRTPLAVQRTALQVGLADECVPPDVAAVREELLEQNRRTEHLVESLLVLAEADRGLDGRRTESIDLSALAAAVADAIRPHAQGAGVTVDCRLDGTTSVVAEPVLLRQMLGNLLDNAVEYNRPGGWVTLSVTGDTLRVENSGTPLGQDDVDTLVRPFRRGDAAGSKRHSGLGLSIVESIARAHGWALVLRARTGGGLVVVVRTV